ncbi:hypothetical protein NPS53_08770 [Pseudomonas putida]|uniref:hypothetical protein n=1 Tax=Pseudomonas putida TaxID=303 RepID=UPI00236453DB|nr:hypothetical protein [Pseudomonas putida]MDD2139666.1 hypothetical protein [Pseudomonas putida]HDS1721590.1 hypothetical protein [Pseudomonas putida]
MKTALLRFIATVFSRKTSAPEVRTETPCVPVAQDLEVAFRYAQARLPILHTKHKNLGDEASVLKGRKIAWVETGEVSVCLHFEDGSTFTVSAPQN